MGDRAPRKNTRHPDLGDMTTKVLRPKKPLITRIARNDCKNYKNKYSDRENNPELSL